MALLEDFKKFAFKGNVVDLAVGVIIGGAFGKIVSSLVADLVMPVVSLALPSGDWREHGVILRAAADPKDNVVLKYGDFVGNVLDFLIVAFVLFLLVSRILKAAESALTKKNKKDDETRKEAATKECPFCLETVPFKAKRCKSCTSELPMTTADADLAKADVALTAVAKT